MTENYGKIYPQSLYPEEDSSKYQDSPVQILPTEYLLIVSLQDEYYIFTSHASLRELQIHLSEDRSHEYMARESVYTHENFHFHLHSSLVVEIMNFSLPKNGSMFLYKFFCFLEKNLRIERVINSQRKRSNHTKSERTEFYEDRQIFVGKSLNSHCLMRRKKYIFPYVSLPK